ncbi:MAG: cyclase family protein [Gammaproteobacteria bacterium]
MAIELTYNGQRYRAAVPMTSDIALPLAFDATGPQAFGAPAADSTPLSTGGFSGRVAAGASCNASVLSVTPHGNGTHTESVAHLVEDGPAVPALLAGGWMPAWLGSVQASPGTITASALEPVLHNAKAVGAVALVLRTLPNISEKMRCDYSGDAAPAFFESDAARAVADAGIEHWLVDLPSLDRLDDPALPAHRAFFGLPPASHRVRDARRRQCTVTELIYVADELVDGLYLLDLQVPRWQLEAVPSRPLLMAAELLEDNA